MRVAATLTISAFLLGCAGCRAPVRQAKAEEAKIPAADFYVATDGSDAWSGTLAAPNADKTDGPFASLEKARDAVRQKRAAGTAGATVIIRGGVYPRSGTFELGKEDSGTAESPVVYEGAPGEEVRLSGGCRISSSAFRPVTDPKVLERLPEASRKVVVQIDLAAQGVKDFGKLDTYGHAKPTPERRPELFVNGQAMRLARWPNEGWVRTGKVIDRGSVWGSNVPGQPALREKPDRGAIFEFRDERLARWAKADELWLFGFWWWDWADQAVKVESIDLDKKTIKTVHAHTYGYRTGRRFYAFNLLEEIDAPGECYLDREGGMLYLYPPGPMAEAEVEFSQLLKPLAALAQASHVVLRNIVFETSRGTAVVIRGGEANRVVACTVRKIAGTAIAVSGGKDHHVASCDIYDTNGGVSVSGGDWKALTAGNHVVENCHIHRYSRLSKTYVSAIRLDGCGLTARHNLIHDAPHMAIGFSGNDHVIEFNDIYDVCQETSDAGVIYAGRNWTMRGNMLRYNFIHDIIGIGGCGAQGIYLDDCFSSATMIGNVFYRMNNLAFLIGGGRDNIIVNNVAVETGPVHIDSRGMGWGSRNAGPGGGMEQSLKKMPYKEEPWASRYPKLVGILDDEPPVPKGNIVQRNLFVRTPAPKLAKAVVENGTVSDNLVTDEDPGFVDFASLDLRLRSDSQVFEQIPGFKEIPFAEIGLYQCDDRPMLPPFSPSFVPGACGFVGHQEVTIGTRSKDAEVRYTTDGSAPSRQSALYTKPIVLTESATLRAAVFVGTADNGQRSGIVSASYDAMHLDREGGVPLSRLPMVSYSGYCEPKRDSNMAAALIVLGGETYQRGLLLHPGETPNGRRGHAEFALAGGLAEAKRFRATVGIEGTQRTRGSVAFLVEGHRDGAWQELAKTSVLKGGQPPQELVADVAGCDRVRLVVTDGGDNIHADHAAWGNARFTTE